MITFRLTLAVMCVCTISVSPLANGWTSQGAASAPSTPREQEGRRLFLKYGCYECHGHEGQGGSPAGPRIGPNPVPIAAFLRYVRSPSNQMPPYTMTVASDDELIKIREFLQRVSRPVSVDERLKASPERQ
jgi:mono/diheme cytochrome c family protein